MMFGLREAFEYHQCASCGSLQIATVPADLAPYYPDNYYSMDEAEGKKLSVREKLVRELHRLHSFNFAPLNKLLPEPRRGDYKALIAAKAKRDDRILDVGCGSKAKFLRFLDDLGFSDLSGADPFIDKASIKLGSVRVERKYLEEVEDTFDVITLNHSFEHVPDPRGQMKQVARVLKPGGRAAIRVPTVSSEAFETYGPDWVQLDAPRHLNVPSRAAVRLMIANAGLKLIHEFDDSSDLQFRGSELYRRNIPLTSVAAKDAFSEAELSAFRARAAEVNRQGRGDQSAFIAVKP